MDWAIPSNVAVLDFNGDGMLDRAYVGDLGGQMWRIDGNLDGHAALLGAVRPQDLLRARRRARPRLPLGLLRHRRPSNPLDTSVVDRMYGVKDDGTLNLTESDLVDVTTRRRAERLDGGSDAQGRAQERSTAGTSA